MNSDNCNHNNFLSRLAFHYRFFSSLDLNKFPSDCSLILFNDSEQEFLRKVGWIDRSAGGEINNYHLIITKIKKFIIKGKNIRHVNKLILQHVISSEQTNKITLPVLLLH